MTRQSTLTGTVEATISLLRNPETIPAMYQWYADTQKMYEDVNQVALCYDHPIGLMDRESLICQDDLNRIDRQPASPRYMRGCTRAAGLVALRARGRSQIR